MSEDERVRIGKEQTSVWQRETSLLWADRRTVSLFVRFDSSGAVTGTELQENHGLRREADSVRAVAEGWVFAKEWVRSRPQGRWAAVVALDRGGRTHRERSQPLPPAIGALLRKHPLAEWMRALQSIHPEAAPEYFRSYGSWHLFKVRGEGMLREEMMRRKASCDSGNRQDRACGRFERTEHRGLGSHDLGRGREGR